MKRALLLAALASLSPLLHAKPVAPTIEQMAAFPAISSLSLSPDGKHIAAFAPMARSA
jgi:hypothetical protein